MELRQQAKRELGRIDRLAEELRGRISAEEHQGLDADMVRRYRAECSEIHKSLMTLERILARLEDLT